jgi:uncharacterized protein
MIQISRRTLIAFAAALPTIARAQETPLSFYTAGPGSAFLPYGQGLITYATSKGGPRIQIADSTGSIVNLNAVENSATAIGTVFLGSAHEAMNGIGAFQGKKLMNIRALFPMYETSFQIAVLNKSGIGNIRQLAGKKVGVGPKGGPAELFFRGLAEVAGISPEIANGTSADQAKALLAGEIDALWQGAVVPIPSLKSVSDQAEVTILGIEDSHIQAVLQRFPTLSAATIPANSYRGQTQALRSIAAWNFVVANKDMPDALAATLTRLVMTATDPAKDIHPSAAGTRRENATTNGFLPFHPGALSVYKELGMKVFGG